MLHSQLSPLQKKNYAYSKRATSNEQELFSTKCVLISVTIFWFAFILYLQFKFFSTHLFSFFTHNIIRNYTKQHRFKEDNTAQPTNTSQHETHSPTNEQSILFWGNRDFDTTEFLQQLSMNTDSEIFAKCKTILTSKHPKRDDIWSQAYQEWYIYHNFFYGKTNGIYLDIGSHKPLHLSNTAFFDQCMGWSGICVEPTQTSELFADVRSCNVARKCAWSESTKLVMIFRSDGDASLIIDEKEQNRIKREVPDRVKDLFECEAIDAMDLLNEYKVKNKFGEEIDISTTSESQRIEIDFISLDVEGAEVEFLSCFPFEKYDVKVWSIEINKNEGLIDELMLRSGFMKFEYLSYFQSRLDAIYVKVPVSVKLPWIDEEGRNKWSKYKRCPNRE